MNKDQYKPFLDLANAVIEQAARDYRENEPKRKRTAIRLANAEKKLAAAKSTKDESLIKSAEKLVERIQYRADVIDYEQMQIERFFRSSWFALLSDLDGELLLKQLQAEIRTSG